MSRRVTGTLPLGCVSTIIVLLLLGSIPAFATPGDTTWVRTFDHDFYNWATPHDATFEFPNRDVTYSQVLLYYTIGCPGLPGDCDPWDRLGYLKLLHETGKVFPDGQPEIIPYEIARIVTPYDITGGTRPDSCIWVLDVSDYEPLLHGEVTLRNYIESWMGNDQGWLVTIDFAFIEGVPDLWPISIENLWGNYRAVYGDPDRPIEDYTMPLVVDIHPLADAVKVRLISTGHGQGNTTNCAEFCAKRHYIITNGDEWSERIWRDDCEFNTCSPQGGTWTYDRAGWCPGDKVTPLDVDITASVTPGSPANIDYNIQDYVNQCRPNNPDCIDGTTCTDCDYNYTGHTEPVLSFQVQMVQYMEMSAADVVADGMTSPGRPMVLRPNSPNPFRPDTWIRYVIAEPGVVRVSIHDAGGRLVQELAQEHGAAGSYKIRWDGKDADGQAVSAGVYFYAVRIGEEIQTRKMQLLR